MSNWYLYCKKADFSAISRKFNISPITARILVNRGLKSEQEIQDFFYGEIKDTADPFLFKDMKKAAVLMLEAIRSGRKVRIIGDYDADGVCSSVILKKFLSYAGCRCDVRLPNRMLEGYGMNPAMAEEAFNEGISLIITCDNGISSFEAVSKAKELGINVIVTDHHEPPEVIPPADCVIDAKQHDCTYPFKELCGAAVAYKFDLALFSLICSDSEFAWPEGCGQGGAENLLDDLLAFCGIATITDIVPLVGENRIFAKEGIKRIHTSSNPGIKCLSSVKNIDQGSINTTHIGFVLGPCINSAGRLDDAALAFELFDTDSTETAFSIAMRLNELNETRKSLTNKQSLAAVNIITETDAYKNKEPHVYVLYLKDTHESVAGIIAGKLKEMFNSPVLVVTDSEEGLKGSGRSTDDYNLVAALSRNSSLLKKFGGHAKAAGFTLNCTAEELSSALNSEPEAGMINSEKKIWVDSQLPFRYVTAGLVRELEKLEPFGLNNDKPEFAERNVHFSNVSLIGKNQNVLKLIMTDAEGTRLDGIYFSHGSEADETAREVLNAFNSRGGDAQFSVLFRPGINEFRGNCSLQAFIDEIKVTL